MATKIATCNFKFDDWTDNEEDFKHKLEDFLADYGPRSRIRLWNIDYLGINTRYTHRIINKCPRVMQYPGEVESLLSDKDLAAITTDKCWDPKGPDLVKDLGFHEILTSLGLDGTVFFKAKKSEEVFDRLGQLTDIDHCSCCNLPNLCNIDYYYSKGKIIAVAFVDTESG